MRLRLLQPDHRRPLAEDHFGGRLPAVLPTVAAVQLAVEPDVERDDADFGFRTAAAAQREAQ